MGRQQLTEIFMRRIGTALAWRKRSTQQHPCCQMSADRSTHSDKLCFARRQRVHDRPGLQCQGRGAEFNVLESGLGHKLCRCCSGAGGVTSLRSENRGVMKGVWCVLLDCSAPRLQGYLRAGEPMGKLSCVELGFFFFSELAS